MSDTHIPNRETLYSFPSQLLELPQSHFLIRRVVEIQSATSAGMVANDAVEGDDCPVLRLLDGRQKGRGVDGLAHQHCVVGTETKLNIAHDSTAAHRG